ncbi:MAG: serine/threonine protein kinase [Fibrobacteres bacterium]|nr:serine/threonine protein kinase [Fibrobacterota bacterium]
MRNNNGATPSSGVTASGKTASSFRYIPATLASLFIFSVLLGTGAYRSAEPWFYGRFLQGKGEPPASTATLIVTADPGSGAMDAATVARLTASILERGPAVVALAPSETEDPSALESLEGGDGIPAGPLVLSHTFSGIRPWTVSENPIPPYPSILAHSLYPLLDGPEPGLDLPMGEGVDLSDTLITRSARVDGVSDPTTGFAANSSGSKIFSVPAFVRLGRGVVASLGIEAARRVLDVPAGKVGYVEGVGVLFNATHVLPIDPRGEIPLRFYGGNGIPRIPASRFLEGRVSGVEVQGRIVFVDPSAPGKPGIRTVTGLRSPAEIQASLAANFLEGSLMTAPGWGAVLPIIAGTLFAALIIVVLLLDFGAFAALALALLLAAIYPILSYILFTKSSWWLPPVLPPLMTLAAYLPFAATRALAPARRSRPQSIHPSPGYDPSLVSMPPMGRPVPGSHFPTPPHGMPQSVPMAAPPSHTAGAAYPAGSPKQGPQAQQAHPAQFQPGPAFPQRPRPQPPKERQGAGAMAADARPAPEPRFTDPRDPPILPREANTTVDMMPAAPAPVHRQPPSQPPALPHTGTVGDDIERDAKGGLIRVGKYRIVRKLGFGSAGDVFEGFDTHMGRKVAIKTITKNAAAHFDRASERFVMEAKAAGSLNHPCINTIYDFGTIRDVSYMVLEFLDGITLSQWMRGNPQPPRPAAISHWLQQISSALDYAHGAKIIHRDLKPSNLMVVNNGATIKLLDFGIAKMEDVGLTQTGMTVGTPSYMSPEQLSGIKVGPASDQYGLAVVIYQLFTYKLPYIGTKIPELCNRILKNDLIPITEANPSLGAPFWEALKKAMAKTPEERYPNCLALYAALEAAFPNP